MFLYGSIALLQNIISHTSSVMDSILAQLRMQAVDPKPKDSEVLSPESPVADKEGYAELGVPKPSQSPSRARQTKDFSELKTKISISKSVFEKSEDLSDEISVAYIGSALLQAMAADSSKLRDSMKRDGMVMWVSMMGVFNVIIPRIPKYLQHPKSPLKSNPRHRASRASFSNMKSNSPESSPVPANHKVSSNQRPEVVYTSNGQIVVIASNNTDPLVESVNNICSSVMDYLSSPLKKQNTKSKGITLSPQDLPESEQSSGVDNFLDEEYEEVASNIYTDLYGACSDLYMDFGPPQKGFSAEEWKLLALSRVNIENIMKQLEINVPLAVSRQILAGSQLSESAEVSKQYASTSIPAWQDHPDPDERGD